MENLFNIGTIVNTHGIRGMLKIKLSTDFPEERFKVGQTVHLKNANLDFKIKESAKYKNMYLVQFNGIDNINQVEKYKNDILQAERIDDELLTDNTFLIKDILGIVIYDDSTKEVIGKVSDVLQPGANDVWEVVNEQGNKYYIPFLNSIFKSIDIANNAAFVDLPGGIIDED